MRALVAAWLALAPVAASAHGINGHVHVTGWALESLPPGELRDFFGDPAMRDTAQIGAAFPDSGYAIDDPYGEIAHWEPFINTYVEWIATHYAGDYSSDEARRHIAFMMGAASHGLQDEIFDTLFLRYLVQEDGVDQDVADSGTDGMLFTDGWLEFKPPLFYPEHGLVEVFQAASGYGPDPDAIRQGMERVKILVIDRFAALAPGFDARYRPQMPWGSQHYMDADVPGSIRSEVPATAAYMLALWERLHGRFEPQGVARYTWPTATRRLRSVDHTRVDAWVTLMFGTGARVGSLNADTVQLFAPDGTRVEAAVQHTRWSGNPNDSTRLVVLVPQADLALDTEYEVRLLPGIELQDHRLTTDNWTWRFKTPCPEAGECSPGPDADPLDPPQVDYPLPPDAAVPMPDAAALPADAALATPDAAPPPPTPDAAPLAPDAAVSAPPAADGAPESPPANVDLGVSSADAAPPASTSGSGSGGGGCGITPAPLSPAPLLWLLPLALVSRLSRRRVSAGS